MMFKEIEQKAKEELISFYEDFISDPYDKSLGERGLTLDQSYTGVPTLSKQVSSAAWGASRVEFNKLSVEEAKKILESLKQEE